MNNEQIFRSKDRVILRIVNIIKEQENTIEDIRRQLSTIVQHDSRILAKDYNDLIQKQQEMKKNLIVSWTLKMSIFLSIEWIIDIKRLEEQKAKMIMLEFEVESIKSILKKNIGNQDTQTCISNMSAYFKIKLIYKRL